MYHRRLVQWDPFREMRKLMSSWPTWPVEWEEAAGDAMRFSLDVYEEGDSVIVKADLPGVDPDNVDINVTEDTVTIQAEKKEEIEEKKRDYLRKERRYGAFARTLALPTQVVPDKAEAQFEKGTLTLTMPKAAPEKSKQVKVKIMGKEG